MARIIVTKPSQDVLDELGITTWPIWTCEVSKFDWHYDQKETCYLLEGKVTVTTDDQEVTFGTGEFVVFPVGLDCVWDVTEPVRKHYQFG